MSLGKKDKYASIWLNEMDYISFERPEADDESEYHEFIDRDAYDKAIEALKFLASNEAYNIEDSDPETGYFDVYKGPQHFAEVILKELGVECE